MFSMKNVARRMVAGIPLELRRRSTARCCSANRFPPCSAPAPESLMTCATPAARAASTTALSVSTCCGVDGATRISVSTPSRARAYVERSAKSNGTVALVRTRRRAALRTRARTARLRSLAALRIRTREASRIRTQRSIGWTSDSDDLGKLGGEVLDERADRREHALPVGHQCGQRRVLGLRVGQYPP